MNRQSFTRGAIAASVAAVFAAGYISFGLPIVGHAQAAGSNSEKAPPAATAQPVPATPTAASAVGVADFSPIVDRYGPAVVNITVTGKAQPTALDNSPGIDPNDPFFEFFRRFGPQFPRVPEGSQMVRGLGSGFIVSSDGTILTNAHVVDNAQEVTVKLTDGREFKAKVVGVDHQSDVAVIKIDAKNLPTVKLGDPSTAKVGEPVLAIGSPYGFQNTATSGIISAKSRTLSGESYVPFIQTDVAVNPGNSGGPLFNAHGEVIGINSQIYSRTGGYQGLSFAIPINVAAKIQGDLVAHGKVIRGRLGVTVQEVNQALAESFGLSKPEGALVSSVEKGGPAEKAGLEPGDVIVRFGDHAIAHSAELPSEVADTKPGATVKVEVIRKGATKTLSVTVGEMKDTNVAQNDESGASQGRLGVAVRPLQPEEKRQAGVTGGLLVQNATGPAARAGIQPGDVILSFNGTPVTSVEELRGLVQKAGKNAALLVQRDNSKIFVPVELG
jgi:serine protease Do